MIAAYASLAVVVVASVVVGQAILSLCGRRDLVWLSGPVGLAGLLVVAGISADLPGHATAIAVALAVVTAASGLFLLLRRPSGLGAIVAGLPAAILAVLAASIPFIVAGRVGILGVGLVNDDMASHLLLASWIDERFLPEPVLVDQGYPLGPHALVAGLEKLLGAGEIEGFAGLTLAVPALTALVAFGVLERLRPVARALSAAATALPYLVVAYLAQEAFKEPIVALFVLAFALALPQVRSARDATALGVIAAGTVYVYSFPGLAWLLATTAIWATIELIRNRPRAGALARGAVLPAAAAAGAALILLAPDLGRILDFADFRALDPDRANEGGLGNLRGHLSPLEALGVWPTSEFRLSAGAGSLPALVFYLGAALGATALALGLPRWIRRHGTAVPAALAAATLVYIAARSQGTVYTSAKALAVASPLIMLIALGGLLGSRERSRAVIAALLVGGAALSSFLVLRQAPVGPETHMDELAQIRPLVQGEKVLFLGRDNFVLYELHGSKPFTHVRNFYDPYFVRPNFELREVGSKFDFDAVEAEKLDRFPYVITTRASYASGPPPSYVAVLATADYVLWRQAGAARGREPVERGLEPTGRLRCRRRPAGFPPRAALPTLGPVRADAGEWSTATIEDGSPATIELDLPAGRWGLSLRYDATQPVTLEGPGLEARLPSNLDYRGVTPYWPAGEIVSAGEPIEITASVEPPSAVGRLLGASSAAHLGDVGATPAGPGYVRGLAAPHPGLGERLVRGRLACSREADWIATR